MSIELSEEQKQQVLTMGRLGWPMRRYERETGIHLDTAAQYLRDAGIAPKTPGRLGNETGKSAISSEAVIPDSCPPNSKPAIAVTAEDVYVTEISTRPSGCASRLR